MKRMLPALLTLLLVLAAVSIDPLSPPALSQLCLSHGEIRVSCLSTGDEPQYSWTLDNRTLDGGVAFLSNETQTVILRRNVSGSITCTAHNSVSRENTTQELQKCPGLGAPVICTLCNGTEIFLRAGGAEMVSAICTSRPHTPKKTSDISQQTPPTCGYSGNVVLPAVLGVCLLLMVLLLGTCYLYKKQKQRSKTSQISAGDRCEDSQELVYSLVQVAKKKQCPKKQEQEPQVVYGEVKVSKAVRHSSNRQTEMIYSRIRT